MNINSKIDCTMEDLFSMIGSIENGKDKLEKVEKLNQFAGNQFLELALKEYICDRCTLLKKSINAGNSEAHYQYGKVLLFRRYLWDTNKARKTFRKGYERYDHLLCGIEWFKIECLFKNHDDLDVYSDIMDIAKTLKKARSLIIKTYKPKEVDDDDLSTIIDWIEEMREEESDENKKELLKKKLEKFLERKQEVTCEQLLKRIEWDKKEKVIQ